MSNVKTYPGASSVASSGLATKLQMLKNKGQVRSIRVHNQGGATVYLMIFDSVAAPSVGVSLPALAPVPIVAGGYYESQAAFDCVNGCWIAASTDPDGYGEIGGNTVWFSGTVS